MVVTPLQINRQASRQRALSFPDLRRPNSQPDLLVFGNEVTACGSSLHRVFDYVKGGRAAPFTQRNSSSSTMTFERGGTTSRRAAIASSNAAASTVFSCACGSTYFRAISAARFETGSVRENGRFPDQTLTIAITLAARYSSRVRTSPVAAERRDLSAPVGLGLIGFGVAAAVGGDTYHAAYLTIIGALVLALSGRAIVR